MGGFGFDKKEDDEACDASDGEVYPETGSPSDFAIGLCVTLEGFSSQASVESWVELTNAPPSKGPSRHEIP